MLLARSTRYLSDVSVVNRGPETDGPPGQNFSHSVGILDSDSVNRQASHPCAASALNGKPRVVKFSHGKLNPPRLHTDLEYTPRPRPETLQGCSSRQVGATRLLPFSPFASAVVSPFPRIHESTSFLTKRKFKSMSFLMKSKCKSMSFLTSGEGMRLRVSLRRESR